MLQTKQTNFLEILTITHTNDDLSYSNANIFKSYCTFCMYVEISFIFKEVNEASFRNWNCIEWRDFECYTVLYKPFTIGKNSKSINNDLSSAFVVHLHLYICTKLN